MRKNRYLPRILLVGAMAVGGVLFYQSYTGEVKQELVGKNPVPSFVEPPDPKPLVPESPFYSWDDQLDPKPFSPELEREIQSLERFKPPELKREIKMYERFVDYFDLPICKHYIESCVCDGILTTLTSNPPQYICDGIESCADIDRYEPVGCRYARARSRPERLYSETQDNDRDQQFSSLSQTPPSERSGVLCPLHCRASSHTLKSGIRNNCGIGHLPV